MEPYTILFFGRTGAGKGTQAHLLQDYLREQKKEVLYIETGARFRLFTEEPSYTAKYTKKILEDGGLLPDFLPVALWGRIFMEEYRGDENIILDGLARRENEAVLLDSALSFFQRKNTYVLDINISPEWAENVLKTRGRADDDSEDIKHKMEWFELNTIPAINHFKNNSSYTFIEINGEQTVEQVHNDILKALKII